MSVQYEQLVVGPLETNCYVIWDPATLVAAVIDPGGNPQMIKQQLRDNDLAASKILLTHGHPDHFFSAGELAADYNIDILMHQADRIYIEESMALAEMFYDMSKFVSLSPLIFINDGDELNLGDATIEVIHTPGHSPGGLCFRTDAGVFCGDTIFAGSIGRTDFPGGSHSTLISSIQTKLLPLPDDTKLFPGHGGVTTVGRERATNPFLQ